MDPINFIFKHLSPLTRIDSNDVRMIGNEIPIPHFEESVLLDFLDVSRRYFIQSSTPLVKLCTPVYIIGDLHGNFHDFLRIINQIEEPFTKTILILGDYIDRGDFQIELVIMLLSLIIQYPLNFLMLRGNHEFKEVNQKNGFSDEISRSGYSTKLWESFNDVFNYLPMAALINDSIFCCHGGIGPNFTDISQIPDNIHFPYRSFEHDEFIKEMLWSDPSYKIHQYQESPRGVGCLYGTKVLHHFLSKNSLTMLIRGHESITTGVQCNKDHTLFTVFSSSGYNNTQIPGGFIHLNKKGELEPYVFEPITKNSRETTNWFYPKYNPEKQTITNVKSFTGFFLAKPNTQRRKTLAATTFGFDYYI